MSYFGDDVYAELVVFDAEHFCFYGTVGFLWFWACFVCAAIGVAGYVECFFEGEDVFSPGDVASFEWLFAVWAQLYFWLEIYLFCPAVVFGFLHNCLRLQLGIKT